MTEINIYCDESCHLPNDNCQAMALGAIWLPTGERKRISRRIRAIKQEFGISPAFEVKWVKVSPAKLEFYQEIIRYFFDEPHLHFRVLVVPDKNILDHEKFNQTHDDWYYKMYFALLSQLLTPDDSFNIYLDYKDTQGAKKVEKLHEVLCNSVFDFNRKLIQKIQLVQSDESEEIQLVDLLTGMFSYKARGLQTSPAKLALIDLFKERSHYSMERTTLLREDKTNIFYWRPK